MPAKNKKVLQVKCPDCRSILWIDPVTQQVLKSERPKKRKGSLEEMLLKEKQKKDAFARKLEVTAEIQKEKHKKAREKFRKALGDFEDPEDISR